MNKKVICIIVCVILCVLAGVGINSFEKSKKDDLKTNPDPIDESISGGEKQTENVDSESMSSEIAESVGNTSDETTESTDSHPSMMIDASIKIEFLSSEIVDDSEMAEQTTYAAEYFKSGEIPAIDPEEPRKTYVFVKCKLINTTDRPVNSSIALYGFIENEGSPYLDLREGECYFDKAENVNGEDRQKRFFWYKFEPGEELECVVGYAFRETEAGKETETYYLGKQPLGVDYFTLENTKGLIINVSELGD